MSCGTVSLITQVGLSKNVLCVVYVGSPGCGWVLVIIGIFVHGIDLGYGWLRINPVYSVWVAVQVLTTWSKIHPGKDWYSLRSPFGYVACEVYWILLWCCLKLATECVGTGLFGRDSSAGQCKMLSVSDLSKLFRATNNSLWLPLLGMGTCR